MKTFMVVLLVAITYGMIPRFQTIKFAANENLANDIMNKVIP
jgi:hypothetical protein